MNKEQANELMQAISDYSESLESYCVESSNDQFDKMLCDKYEKRLNIDLENLLEVFKRVAGGYLPKNSLKK